MSEISDSAQGFIYLADYASTDAVGKHNIIGGGVSVTGIDPNSGQSAPLTLLAVVDVDPRFVGQSFAFEIGLYDAAGQVVTPPLPGASGIRVAQLAAVNAPTAPPGGFIPPGTVRPATNVIMSFPGGLPLAAGQSYEWRLSVDTHLIYKTVLAVAGPPPMALG